MASLPVRRGEEPVLRDRLLTTKRRARGSLRWFVLPAVAIAVLLAVGATFLRSHTGGLVDLRDQRWDAGFTATPTSGRPTTGVTFRLALTNASTGTEALDYPTSRQWRVVVEDGSGRVVWRLPSPVVSAPVSRSVAPSATVSYRAVWHTGDVPAGTYRVLAVVTAPQFSGTATWSRAIVVQGPA